jgi:PAS domain S-box-containing protein
MPEAVRILYVDDYILDRALVREALLKQATGFDLTEAVSREEFEALLDRGPFDLVLSDFNILGYTGLEVVRIVQERVPGLPVVIVTGTGNEEVAAESIKLGAADYVVKSERALRHLPQTIRLVLERRDAELALQESRQEYRELVENLNDVIFRLDAEGVIRYVSPAVGLLGLEAGEAVGWPFERFIHPDDLGAVRPAFQGVLAGRLDPSEFRLLARDGGARWVRSSSRPYVKGGAVAGIQGVLTDISERKRAEEELRQSAERFRRVTESANDAIILADGSGLVVSWNAAAERMFGYNEAEALAQSLATLMPERWRILHEAGMRGIENGGEPRVVGRTVELRAVRKGGDEFEVELSLSRWESAQGRFYTGILRDITERKRAEATIKSQLDELHRWHDVMLGREDRVQELKREVNELCLRIGETVRYPSQEDEPADAAAAKSSS